MANTSKEPDSKLAKGYEKLFDASKNALDEIRHDAGPVLHKAIDTAAEKISALGEYTREESEILSNYLKRDLQSAAEYIADEEKTLADWLRLDKLYLKDKMLEALSTMVDQTREELAYLQARASVLGEWHSGEIAGVGTLECVQCGQAIHFDKPGHIPPCPKCRASVFRRPLP